MSAYEHEGITIHLGDCREVMAAMSEHSIDAIVCDPPYGLEFMGKDWDTLGDTRQPGDANYFGRAKVRYGASPSYGWQAGGGFSKPGIGERKTEWPSFSATNKFGTANPTCGTCGGRLRGKKKCSCETPEWKPIGKRRDPANEGLDDMTTSTGMGSHLHAMQEWHLSWATEALRVAKPGAHLLAFGGTRTFHRLACALEDAGWEIRDCVMWVYGSGFPKSLDVSNAIDKAAKVPRTEVTGTRHRNVKPFDDDAGWNQNNTTGDFAYTAPATDAAKQWDGWGTALKPAWEPIIVARKPLDGTVAATVQKWGTGALNIEKGRIESGPDYQNLDVTQGGNRSMDFGMAERKFEPGTGRWPANVIHDGSQEVLDLFPETTAGVAVNRNREPDLHNQIYGGGRKHDGMDEGYGDPGSAARFFYTAKASASERAGPLGEDNTHPTVKPLTLMQYLLQLVMPPGGVALDPFAGSGSTLLAAKELGMRAIGIEQDETYLAIAVKRLAQGVLPL